jgi:L-gulonolactone oxidase
MSARPAPEQSDEPLSASWRLNNVELSPRPVVVDRIGMDALVDLTDRTAAHGSLKALGDGWAYSEVGRGSDLIVRMASSFDEVLDVDGARRLVRVGGGTRIRTIDDALARCGLALPNAPGFDLLTFAGVAATGGQGSGLAFGSLSSLVRSVQILTYAKSGSAQLIRVEPQGGPRLVSSRSETLLVDDELFFAVTTGLGAMGIITELAIEVVPAFAIEEERTLTCWSALKGRLPSLFEAQRSGELHSAEVWMNPYPVGGEVWCVLGVRRAVESQPSSGARGWGVRAARAETVAALCALMNRLPSSAPALLNASLRSTISGKVIMPSSEGLSFGAPNGVRVTAAAVAIPLAGLAEAIDDLIERLHARSELGRVTTPLGLRFVGATDAWLSPAHGRESCLVEMPLLWSTNGKLATLDWFVRDGFPLGRPHWGQYFSLSASELRERYPRESTLAFHRALARLDPGGVFDDARIADLRRAWRPEAAAVPRACP